MLRNRDETCSLIKNEMKRYDCCPQWAYRGSISSANRQDRVGSTGAVCERSHCSPLK